MNFSYYKNFLLLLSGVLLSAYISPAANALENIDSSGQITVPFYLTKNIKSNSKTNVREYTFKAPDSKNISNTEQIAKARGYKVEVYGSESELLRQVKDIEPTAFIQGNTIQVGIFSQQANAQSLVQKLATQGFWARIKTIDN